MNNLVLRLILLFIIADLQAQVSFVVDSNGQNFQSNNLYLYNGAAHCDFELYGHYRIQDTIARIFHTVPDIQESGTDSIFYYGLQDDSILHRYRSDSAKWYSYSGTEAYRPVVHKGDEYFIQIVRGPAGIVNAWRLNKIENNRIIYGPNNPLGDFHPASWNKWITYRNSYRTGGLISNGKHLIFAGVRQVNSNQINEHYELIVSEIKGLGQFDTLQILRPLSDNFLPVVEPLGLVGDSVFYFHIKEIPNVNFGLNAPIRFIASLNLRNGNFKRLSVHQHHYAGFKAGILFWNDYLTNTLLDSAYLFNSLSPSLPAFVNYRVIGQDDSGYVYFQAQNKSLDIWRSNVKKTERFHYDEVGSKAEAYLGHYAGMVQDSLLALVYNKSGDVRLLIKNIYTRSERHFDLNDTLNGFRPEYRLKNMVYEATSDALYFLYSERNNFIGNIIRCSLNSLSQIQNPTSIQKLESSVRVFPNPIHDYIFLSSSGLINNITLQDLTGKSVKATVFYGNDKVSIDCSNIPQGMYLLQYSIDGRINSNKIVRH